MTYLNAQATPLYEELPNSDSSEHWQSFEIPHEIERITGQNRADTAVNIADVLKEENNNEINSIFIVNGGNIADAIAVTPLAAANNGVILLADTDHLYPETKEWLQKNNHAEVTLIGGNKVLDEKIVEEISDITGVKPQRIAGDGRHETAIVIANKLAENHGFTRFIIADSHYWQDSLPIAIYAAKQNTGLLLMDKDNLHPALDKFISDNNEFVYTVLGETFSDELRSKLDGRVETKRFDYKIENIDSISPFLIDNRSNKLLVTNPLSPIDIVSAGPLAAKNSGLVLADESGALALSAYGKRITNASPNTLIAIGGNKAVSTQRVKELSAVGLEENNPERFKPHFAEVHYSYNQITASLPVEIDSADFYVTSNQLPIEGTIHVKGNDAIFSPDEPFRGTTHISGIIGGGDYLRHIDTTVDIKEPKRSIEGWAVAETNDVEPVVGFSGRLFKWTAEVHPEIPVNVDYWAEVTEKILYDHRGWTANGAVSLQRIENPSKADIRLVLAPPAVVDRECRKAGLFTHGEVSCWNGSKAMINILRWTDGVKHIEDLETYRGYLISHEFGHGLGHHHPPSSFQCKDSSTLAPVMLQQTYSLRSCKANPWPFPNTPEPETQSEHQEPMAE